MEERPDMYRPALLGGILIGVISAVPGINLINCFCCAGVIIGGILSVHFYNKNLGDIELEYVDGVKVGLMAGVFGAFISTILGSIISGTLKHQIDKVLEYSTGMPPEVEDLLVRIQESQSDLFFIIIGLVIALIIDGIFGVLGGVIGVSLFKKKKLEA